MWPVTCARRRDRLAAAVDDPFDASRVVDVAGYQHHKIVAQADKAAVEHPVRGA